MGWLKPAFDLANMAQHSFAGLIILIMPWQGAALPLRHVADPCACKNWKETYQNGGVPCGAGNELYFMIGGSVPEQVDIDKAKAQPAAPATNRINATAGQMFCMDMYERFDFDMCVNINI